MRSTLLLVLFIAKAWGGSALRSRRCHVTSRAISGCSLCDWNAGHLLVTSRGQQRRQDGDQSGDDRHPREFLLGAELVDGPVKLAENEYTADDEGDADQCDDPSAAGSQREQDKQCTSHDFDDAQQRRVVPPEDGLNRLVQRSVDARLDRPRRLPSAMSALP